jgi:hypothetical protein
MNTPSRLPVWTPVADDVYIYEALDSQDRVWRLWWVRDPAPDDAFPAGWRFAPGDALDQVTFLPHQGGGREGDAAAARIDLALFLGNGDVVEELMGSFPEPDIEP